MSFDRILLILGSIMLGLGIAMIVWVFLNIKPREYTKINAYEMNKKMEQVMLSINGNIEKV